MLTKEATLDAGALGAIHVDVEYTVEVGGEVCIRHVWGAPTSIRIDLYPLLTEWAVDELVERCSKTYAYD